MFRTLVLMAALALSAPGADFPQAEISNGQIRAVLLLPDVKTGYYRGTRFDWSGAILSLKYQGHDYFGPWRDHDPTSHDAIAGPVEEFRGAAGESSPGYEEIPVGGLFPRIGIGMVKKPDTRPFQFARSYELVNPGQWQVRTGKDRVEFVHRLKDQSGWGYEYRKVVRLVKGRPQMVIEHQLRNTGSKVIDATQYNHNFFVMDNQPTGPDFSIQFPFTLASERVQGPGRIEGGRLLFNSELQARQNVFGFFTGFGNTVQDYDIRIENTRIGAGVRIRGDQPIVRLVIWSARTTLCPEPYIAVKVEPGKQLRWAYTYDFYTLAGR